MPDTGIYHDFSSKNYEYVNDIKILMSISHSINSKKCKD